MEILALRTSVSSIALVLVSIVILRTKSAFSLPYSSTETSLEESVADVDIICNSQNSVSQLKQLSIHSTECKSNDKEFWVKNCRCSHEGNCQPPKCPQEMTTTTAKTILPTTALLSTILLSSLSTASVGSTIATSTTRHLPTSSVTNIANSTVSANTASIISTTKSHEELPTPAKLVTSNTNFIRLG